MYCISKHEIKMRTVKKKKKKKKKKTLYGMHREAQKSGN